MLILINRFNAKARRRDKQDVEWAIHCALVEIFALKQIDRPIDLVYRNQESKFDYENLAAKTAAFQRSRGATVALKFFDKEIETKTNELLLQKPVEMRVVDLDGPPPEEVNQGEEYRVEEDQEESDEDDALVGQPQGEGLQHGVAARKLRPTAEALAEAQQTWGPLDSSWRSVSLRDPSLKFAVLKRTSQLLGQRIPDPQISSVRTAANLVDIFCKKPKPKKLFRELQHDPKLEGLPNLHVFGGRWSIVQKNDEKGLSKMINQELARKGLAGAKVHRHEDAYPTKR